MSLEPNEKHRRLLNLDESSYVSLMSIVQGVALGAFALAIQSRYPAATFWSVEVLPLAVATLLMIIMTRNEYMMGVAALEWIPSFRDPVLALRHRNIDGQRGI